MTTEMPPLPAIHMIGIRLAEIFPEGIENRPYVIRDIAAKTVFVMLYVGAVEAGDVWIRPDQVTKMSDAQAKRAR